MSSTIVKQVFHEKGLNMTRERITVAAMPAKTPNDTTTCFRLSPQFREAVETLSSTHKTKNLSEYFRGLIYLDALLATGDADLLDKPAWVTRDYGDLIRSNPRRKNAKG